MKPVIFWAQTLNMHIISSFEELARHGVEVTALYYSSANRNYGNLHIKHMKLKQILNKEDADRIIRETPDYVHVNRSLKLYDDEGVRIFNYALRRMLKLKYFVLSLYMEQYYYWGIKGFLRRLRWSYLFNISYARKIRGIGCCGKTGILAHKKALVAQHRLFEFIYTVPTSNSYLITEAVSHNVKKYYAGGGKKYLFIGSLIDRKSIIELIGTFSSINEEYEFIIVGEGPLAEKVKTLIHGNTKIRYLGKLMPSEVRDVLDQADTLILPSKLEGWGCVVNEALMAGCRVIVSNVVGARALIDKEGTRGQVFRNGDWEDLKKCLIKEMKIETTKEKIKKWAINIYPETEAEYFIKVVESYESESKSKPIVPWQ